MSKKFNSISLGQGQGPVAEALARGAIERGRWVFFQNCHLAPSWMPSLERMIEQIDPDKVHRDFRLWLTRFDIVLIFKRVGSSQTCKPTWNLLTFNLKKHVAQKHLFSK